MFTGIIEGIGKIRGKRTVGGGVAYDFEAAFDLTEPQEGESIAVGGVCLTAYGIKGRNFSADVSPETLSRTKLGTLGPGDRVNLERALRLSDRLGGHLVSGHVDCMAAVTAIQEIGNYTLLSCALPLKQGRYIIEKGSIAIDGVSLTVNTCGPGYFSVSIIPHTLKMTSLGTLKVGGKVNIEVDMVGKYIENLLTPVHRPDGSGGGKTVNREFLAKHGFI